MFTIDVLYTDAGGWAEQVEDFDTLDQALAHIKQLLLNPCIEDCQAYELII